MTTMIVQCAVCRRKPEEIPELVSEHKRLFGSQTLDEYIEFCEHTYNPQTGRFWCDVCWIAAGSPPGLAP